MQQKTFYSVDKLIDVLQFSNMQILLVALSFFFFQAEDGIRDLTVTGVQTCALPICRSHTAYPTLPVDDKNSVTADPRVSGVAYAVWDRLVNVARRAAGKPNHDPEVDDHPARGSSAPAQALHCFQGPTLFSRTTDGGGTQIRRAHLR